MAEPDNEPLRRERRVLAKLIWRHAGSKRGKFELGDGRVVEVDGPAAFDSIDAPRLGEKAFIVMDEDGRPLRWEPYPGARMRRRLE